MCKAKYCQYCLYLYFQALLFIDAETNYRYFHFVSNFVSLAVLDFFLSSDTSVCSMMAFFQLGNSDYVVVSVSFDFPSYSKQDALFHCIVYGYSHADWDIFVIIWEMFHGRVSLNSVLLLLLVNFVSGFRLELMYISLIKSVRSNLTHLHGFQLLVLLP